MNRLVPAAYKGRQQSDSGKNHHSGAKRRHVQPLQLPASRHVGRGIIAQVMERAGANAGRINGGADDRDRAGTEK
jgi:hypothetical protein